MSVQVYAARHEKKKLAHKMKEKNKLLQELSLLVNDGVEKKSQVEEDEGGFSEAFENQKKALEETERRFILKERECGKLKRSMKKTKNEYKTKIKNLESQLKEESMQRIGVSGESTPEAQYSNRQSFGGSRESPSSASNKRKPSESNPTTRLR